MPLNWACPYLTPMLRVLTITALLWTALFLTSCASILNPRYQKVSAKTSPETTIYVNDDRVANKRSATLKLERNGQVKQIRVERPGYKTEYDVAYQEKRSWLHIISWVPPFGFYAMGLLDRGVRGFNHAKEVRYSCRTELPEREEDQKYVFLNATGFELDKENIEFVVRKKKNFSKKIKDVSREVGEEDIDIDNTVFTTTLNELLKEQGFADDNPNLLKRKTNTMYVKAKVKGIKFFLTDMASILYAQRAVNANLAIDFELTDIYGVTQYEKSISGKSGYFSTSFTPKGEGGVFLRATEDAIVSAFLKFMDNDEVQALLRYGADDEIKHEPLQILTTNSTFSSDLASSIAATVTIKTENGHGSGFAITNNGYLLTNYHVVAGMDTVLVMNEGQEFPATVVRSNALEDVALLKIDHNFEYCYDLAGAGGYTVGQDVFAIGTPTSIELGQTLSKGIISGLRQVEETELIQTDVSVNPGNSGGALVDSNGKLLGVVTSKISGFGVEGISFSIPAGVARTGLAIQ